MGSGPAESKPQAAKPRGAGKPFQKGQSGNPGGRKKKTQEDLDLEAACRKLTPRALDVVVDVMQNGENERNRLAAAQIIIERAYGKAVQPTKISGDAENPLKTCITVEFIKPSDR